MNSIQSLLALIGILVLLSVGAYFGMNWLYSNDNQCATCEKVKWDSTTPRVTELKLKIDNLGEEMVWDFSSLQKVENQALDLNKVREEIKSAGRVSREDVSEVDEKNLLLYHTQKLANIYGDAGTQFLQSATIKERFNFYPVYKRYKAIVQDKSPKPIAFTSLSNYYIVSGVGTRRLDKVNSIELKTAENYIGLIEDAEELETLKTSNLFKEVSKETKVLIIDKTLAFYKLMEEKYFSTNYLEYEDEKANKSIDSLSKSKIGQHPKIIKFKEHFRTKNSTFKNCPTLEKLAEEDPNQEGYFCKTCGGFLYYACNPKTQ